MGIANLNASTLAALGDEEHPTWIEDNDVLRNRRIQHTIDSLYLAEQLGACTVSTFAGGKPENIGKAEAMSRFLDGLSQVLPHCESTGVALILEPKRDTLIERIGQFHALWDMFESSWLGLNVDIGQLVMEHENPVTELANMKSFVWHVGLDDVSEDRFQRLLPPGEGIVDFSAIFRGLDGIGYTGYVTVELNDQGADAEKVAEEAIHALRQAAPAGLLKTAPNLRENVPA
jgi:sugar phosphate isomerase/epimerase